VEVGGGNTFQLKGNEAYVSTAKYSSTVDTAHILLSSTCIIIYTHNICRQLEIITHAS
jgi:hypothetical protein